MTTPAIPRPSVLQDLPDDFADLRPILEANLEPYIKMTETQVTPPQVKHPADPLTLWQSKLGGNPYFPKQATYPTDPSTQLPMALLVQINCSEVPTIAGFDFPTQGLLQFYVGGAQLAEAYRTKSVQVLYFPEVTEDIEALMTDFSFIPLRETYRDTFDAVYSLSFSVSQDVFLDWHPPDLENFDPDLVADFEDWIYDYYIDNGANHLGSKLAGWPDPHGSVPGHWQRLLLEVANLGGVSESVYFFLEDDRLRARDFSAVRFYHECD
ncbi:MAG: DUF1963 domain-containing protein [Spirulina sp.]